MANQLSSSSTSLALHLFEDDQEQLGTIGSTICGRWCRRTSLKSSNPGNRYERPSNPALTCTLNTASSPPMMWSMMPYSLASMGLMYRSRSVSASILASGWPAMIQDYCK